jgi:hypothetical protein
MKDVLQSICRELDLSDIADIQPAIAKLKAVVVAVPRMDRFITLVSTFVFQRWEDWQEMQSHRQGQQQQQRVERGTTQKQQKKYTLEDVIPILKV